MEWKAIHMYIHDLTFHNRFLVYYLKPAAEKLFREGFLECFFYITYWQGGNHIRFRYRSRKEEAVEREMSACFADFLKIYKPLYVMDETTYYRTYSQNKENVKDIALIEDKTFHPAVYEPEYERYGGRESMEYSEDIFCCSARYALKLRELAGDSLVKRIVFSLDMLTAATDKLDNLTAYLHAYRRYWADFAPSGSQILNAADLAEQYRERFFSIKNKTVDFYKEWEACLTDNMARICACQTSYPDKDTACRMILASQLHMNHNRLGIMPQLESVMAEVLLKCGEGA